MKHNWEYKPVSEIFDTVTDFVAAGSFADLRENVIYNNEQDFAQLIRTTDLKNNFSNSQFVYVNEHAFNYLWRVNLAEECIILPNIGNCGEVYYLHPSMLIYPNNVLGPNAIMVRSKKHNQKYLAFALKGKYFQHQLFQIVSQVAQSKFNKTNLKKLIVPVPSLEVQERIVAELDKINETIEDCRELLRILDALAQSLFYDFFGDPITNPKKWQIKKIKEIGKVITGSTPSTKVEDYYNSHDICFVKPGDIDNSISYISDTKDYISNFAFDSCCRKLPMGTVVVTCIGIIGKVGILKVQANCNQQINAVIPFDAINNIYLAYILKEYAPLFTDAATGPVVKILNKSSFSEFSIPLPPLELQEKFAARIEQIEEQKKSVEQTIAELQTLLDSRMDYWFN
ncbi:MAG: restriction endonuclease subunit S [Muribaculaceae bacterium]|nr:restriction endonuclease subunit S [Muribaculaceae bacterium]